MKMLNDWTYGRVWRNLILARNYFSFAAEELQNRQSNQENREGMKSMADISSEIEARMAQQGPWVMGKRDGNNFVEGTLTTEEINKTKINLLNMAQVFNNIYTIREKVYPRGP